MSEDETNKSSEIAEIAFKTAFRTRRVGQTGESEAPTIESLISRFEDASQSDDDGVEYWLARELQKLLGYTDYRNFLSIVSKAIEACRNSGQPVENHFVDVNEMVGIGSNAEREISEIRLTRYAAYLIAQNGDSRKKQVAFAQTYLAIQTRRQEVVEIEAQHSEPLGEDHKRLLLRDEIKTHNKNLASESASDNPRLRRHYA